MPSMKKRSTSATPITFTLPDRSVRRSTKPKLSGPITIPFPLPPLPHKPLALWEIAEIDPEYRAIVHAIWAARDIRDRVTKDAENQQIVDMLRRKSARCGMPLYLPKVIDGRRVYVEEEPELYAGPWNINRAQVLETTIVMEALLEKLDIVF